MFSNHTSVYNKIIIFLFFAFQVAFFNKSQAAETPVIDLKALKDDKVYERYMEILKFQNTSSACKTNFGDLNKNVAKFNQSCATSGFKGTGSSCISAALKCNECVASSSDDGTCEADSEFTDDDDYEDDEYGNGYYVTEMLENVLSSGQANPQIIQQLQGQKDSFETKRSQAKTRSEAARIYPSCPAMAAKDLKEVKEDVKEVKKEKSDKQSEVDDAQKELQESKNDTQDAIIKIQEEMEDLQQDAQETLQAMQEQAQDGEQKMQEDIQKARDTIMQIADKIKESTSASKEAYISYLDAVAKIEEECINKAQKNLEDIRDRNRKLLSKRQLNQGQFNSLIKKSALSNHKQSERKMDHLFRECRRGRSYRNKIKIIKENYKLALKRIDQQVEILKRSQNQLHQQIMQIIAQMPEKQMRLQQKMQMYQQKVMKQYQRLQQRLQLMQAREMQSNMLQQQKLVRLKGELEDLDNYLSHKKMMLNLKNKYKPDYPSDNEAKVDTMAAFQDVKASISMASAQCDCCSSKPDSSCTHIVKMAVEYDIADVRGCSPYGTPRATTTGTETSK